VVGGKRGDLIIQFLGETLLVTLFAAAIAMLFVKPVVTVFQSFVPQGMTQGLLQPVTLLFLVGIILVTTLLAGFYPAKLSSGVSPISIMKGGTLQKNSRNLLRKSLIVFQFTISLVLIICTMIVGDQIRYLMNKDLGFTQDTILNIRLRGGVANREVFAEKLKQFPFVEMVGFHNNPPPAQAHNGTLFKYNKQGEEIEVTGAIEFCDENYIPMYNVQLVAGRNLLPSRYMREAVINESFARQLGFNDPQDAIGELIWSGQQDRLPDDVPPPEGQRLLQIVGVTADFHYNPLYEKIGPMLMSATTQVGRSMSVKLTMAGKSLGDTRKILADIEKTYKELNPYERYEATFYDDSIAAFYEKEQRTVNIISAAMLMAIFISCMGLFGLVMFTTKQRTKEIGIRKVFGASIYDVLLLLSGGFVKLVILSVLIASPVAWYAMSKWMESFAYHVPLRWWLFILAGLLAIIITLATISLQTIKVARANPVEAIKSE
jgi:ABC-type antimicrobial peptide transport system permease subunit